MANVSEATARAQASAGLLGGVAALRHALEAVQPIRAEVEAAAARGEARVALSAEQLLMLLGITYDMGQELLAAYETVVLLRDSEQRALALEKRVADALEALRVKRFSTREILADQYANKALGSNPAWVRTRDVLTALWPNGEVEP